MLYFLSLGTNMNPKANAVAMVRSLIMEFGTIQLFPFVETAPVDINSGNQFLNSICVINTSLSQAQVKAMTNQIEINMGRDRADPLCSKKDRPADIDIMFSSATPVELSTLLTDEPYVNSVVFGNPKKQVTLSSFGLPSIDRPTTIDLNADTGQIVIVDDEFDCVDQAFKTAL
ncbi:2-amino-4-hydroxy-6-hydroxymethyldihydropteridine diphosphokinase [Aliiglaciecola litoralis]|uniref:2-amino-4-hydroxy-6-hydroxymethyldihydropteridine pyrophosphokinase n=1 Tax=Aliiglaciecola litoralis TaxID=582857 RepID=A0ABN1LQ93_9ALTE